MERLIFLLGFMPLFVASSTLGQSSATLAWIVDGHSLSRPSTAVSGGDATVPNSDPRIAQMVDRCDPVHAGACSTGFKHPFRVYGGYEFGWLQPRFTENVSVVVTRPSGDRAIAFEHPFEITPRVWAGIENSRCTGVRARFWDLRTDAPTQVTFAAAGAAPLSLTIEGGSGNLRRTAVANAGDAMTSDHHLEMRTIDLEGTQRIRFARTEALMSFGLRYLKTRQRAHAVATDGTGSLTELVCQDLDFDGFGPTASIEINRALFCDDSVFRRLSFFADARGSILFGQQEQQLVLVTGGGASLAEDEYLHDDLLPTAELAGGLQWETRPLGCGLWAIRTGYRAESWFGVGGPVDTDSNLGLHGMILSVAASW